jgi:hypothetical protein
VAASYAGTTAFDEHGQDLFDGYGVDQVRGEEEELGREESRGLGSGGPQRMKRKARLLCTWKDCHYSGIDAHETMSVVYPSCHHFIRDDVN